MLLLYALQHEFHALLDQKYDAHRVIDITGVFGIFTKKIIREYFLKKPEYKEAER